MCHGERSKGRVSHLDEVLNHLVFGRCAGVGHYVHDSEAPCQLFSGYTVGIVLRNELQCA